MEAIDFLGGKYQRANPILSGTITTFRAFDPSTGREVFVHRVPASDPAAQQLALLLSSALIRSAKARRLILDVVEEDGYANIVTDTEHQCLLLREWLQFEINQAGGPPPAPSPAPAPAAAPKAETKTPEPKQEPGEFTRMFMASTGDPAAPPTATKVPTAKAPVPEETLTAIPRSEEPTDPKLEIPKPGASQAKPAKGEPGEFTRMFMAATAAVEKEVKPAAPSGPAPQPTVSPTPKSEPKQESGEFTRFFRSPHSPPAKPAAPSGSSRSSERPSNPGFVQRPGDPTPTPAAPPPPVAPPPPPTAKTPEPEKTQPGEFTRMFMNTPSTTAPASSSAPPGRMSDSFANPSGAGMFGGQSQSSEVPASPQKPVGEYTRIFGSGSQAPPVQQQSTVAPPKPPVSDDPLQRAPQFAPVPPPPATSAQGPSEYTLVMSGRAGEPAGNGPKPGSPGSPGGPSAPSIPLPQMQVNVAPPNPMQGLRVPPPPSAGGSMGGASASAHMQGPKMPAGPAPKSFQTPAAMKAPAAPAVPTAVPAPNKNKLVLLFVILGALAIGLVILIVLLLKK